MKIMFTVQFIVINIMLSCYEIIIPLLPKGEQGANVCI